MTSIVSYFPGQQVTLFLETKNSDGYRTDSTTLPYVSRILAFTTSADGYTEYDGYLSTDGYSQYFTKIDTGMYYLQFTLPTTASAVGNYFVDAYFTNPINGFINTESYQVSVTAPFGMYGATNY